MRTPAFFKTLVMTGLLVAASAPSVIAARPVAAIKADILALAQSFAGQGDPDFSRQEALEKLVTELLAAAPQPPVAARLDLLAGPWYQVWGPYDYRGGDRGTVDPKITVGMRITYAGDRANDRADEHIYIMTRARIGA